MLTKKYTQVNFFTIKKQLLCCICLLSWILNQIKSSASLGRTELTLIYFSAPLLIPAFQPPSGAILPNWSSSPSNLARSLDKASRISGSCHSPHRVPKVGVAQWSAAKLVLQERRTALTYSVCPLPWCK